MCCQGTAPSPCGPFPLCTLLDLQGRLWVEVKHIWKGLIQMALVSEEGGPKSDPPWGKGAEVIGGQNAEYYYDEKVKKNYIKCLFKDQESWPSPFGLPNIT